MNIDPLGSLPPKDFIPQKNFDEKREGSEIARLGKAIRYAPDAESLEKHSFKASKQLARQISMPDLAALGLMRTKEEEMEKISGVLWACVDIKPDPLSSGKLCVFRLRHEYDSDLVEDEVKKQKCNKKIFEDYSKLFPANEPIPFEMLYLDPKIEDVKGLYSAAKDEFCNLLGDRYDSIPREGILYIMREFKYQKSLNKLGYASMRDYQGSKGKFLMMPDKTALIQRWNRLRLEESHLPQLDVALSEGIAGDLDFVETFFSWDALLSTGKEFLHDQAVHLLTTLKLMLSSEDKERYRLTADEINQLDLLLGRVENEDDAKVSKEKSFQSYSAERLKIIKEIAKNYHKILFAQDCVKEKRIPKDQLRRINKQLPKIEALLGAMTDAIFAQRDLEGVDLLWENFPRVFLDDQWINYLNERFSEKVKRKELLAVWELINILYEKK